MGEESVQTRSDGREWSRNGTFSVSDGNESDPPVSQRTVPLWRPPPRPVSRPRLGCYGTRLVGLGRVRRVVKDSPVSDLVVGETKLFGDSSSSPDRDQGMSPGDGTVITV